MIATPDRANIMHGVFAAAVNQIEKQKFLTDLDGDIGRDES